MSEILYGDLNLIIWWPREFFCVREVVIVDPLVCKVELGLLNIVICEDMLMGVIMHLYALMRGQFPIVVIYAAMLA